MDYYGGNGSRTRPRYRGRTGELLESMKQSSTVIAFLLLSVVGCNTAPGVTQATGGGGGTSTGGSGGSGGRGGAGGTGGMGRPPMPPPAGTGGAGGAGGAGGMSPPITGFTAADIGGWKLGPEVQGGDDTGVGPGGEGRDCNALVGVVRDFKGTDVGGHPDFERFSGDSATTGMVAEMLGTDRKPVYTGKCEQGGGGRGNRGECPFGQQTSSKMAFDQWYRFTDGVNKPYLIYFQFEPQADGSSVFESGKFFPLDGAGWGNSGEDTEGMTRNFGFTTELHTTFKFNGGERFTFKGDDDLWVFINGKLALDLGGLHPQVSGDVVLDQATAGRLGIEPGKVYPMDLFHAERHTDASNFRVTTNFAFIDCGTIIK
jgi:fibro-slime domain-containing protein